MYRFVKIFYKANVLGQCFELGHGKERQIAKYLRGIRNDHKGRYYFANRVLPASGAILDAACGIGYGAYILAGERGRTVFAIDKDLDAHFFGNKHYFRKNILRVPLLLEDLLCLGNRFDGAVSYETLEHLSDPSGFLKAIYSLCNEGAELVVSVPNEEVLPFSRDRFPFHVQHYMPLELEKLLSESGWTVSFRGSQPSKYSREVCSDTAGAFLIYVCVKGLKAV